MLWLFSVVNMVVNLTFVESATENTLQEDGSWGIWSDKKENERVWKT